MENHTTTVSKLSDDIAAQVFDRYGRVRAFRLFDARPRAAAIAE